MSDGKLSALDKQGIGDIKSPYDNTGTINQSGGIITAQFLAKIKATISGKSTLILKGADKPLASATINIIGTQAKVHFVNKNIQTVEQMLSNISVSNSPAILGLNISIQNDGQNGAIIQSLIPDENFVPEPLLTSLVGLGAYTLLIRRYSN